MYFFEAAFVSLSVPGASTGEQHVVKKKKKKERMRIYTERLRTFNFCVFSQYILKEAPCKTAFLTRETLNMI